MKAAVCYEFNKPLAVEEIEIDPPQRGEVKIRLAATAICRTDIHVIHGELGGELPMVPGHESSGYVEEAGEGVTRVKHGDAVVVSCLISCGKCHYCLNGLPHLCEAKWPLDTESRLHNKRGRSLVHMTRTATFAEFAIVDQSQIAPIPKEMPMDRAALLGCTVITGFGTVVNRAQVKPLSSVVVIGVGGVGISSVQGAKLSGAYPIIAVDISDSRLEAAKFFGATHTINARKTDANKVVGELTSGKGADYVFVAVGDCDVIKQGLLMSGRRGMTVIIGLPATNPLPQMLSLPPHEFLDPEKILTGCYMGSTRLQTDVPRLVSLYRDGLIKLDEMITGRYPLDRINEAIASANMGEGLLNVITFE